MSGILSEVSLATARECKDIKESENCNAKGDCYWAKISSTNSECFSKTDPNFASIIENDLYFTAPVPFEDTQYNVLKLLDADKENFIRLAQQNESFKQLIGDEEFMELLIRIRTDRQAYNTVVEFFQNRFSKENLKNLIPIFLEKKVDEFEQKKLRIKGISEKKNPPKFIPKLSIVQELNNVPELNPIPNVAGGKIPGNIGEAPSDGGGGAEGPDGGEASGTEAPDGGSGAAPDGGGASTVPPPPSKAKTPQKAEGQIVYDSTQPDGAGGRVESGKGAPVYATTDRERTPGLQPRKQPFNIEEKLSRSDLLEQKFPGFWGQAEALN